MDPDCKKMDDDNGRSDKVFNDNNDIAIIVHPATSEHRMASAGTIQKTPN